MKLRKKGAVYSVVALMLCMAVYLNWSYEREDGGGYDSMEEFETAKMLGEAELVDADASASKDSEAKEDYFAEARLSRQQARDEAVSILNTTALAENVSEEAAAEANASIRVMAESAMKESRIESLVIAKGYSDCVVFINEEGINVIVSKPEGGLSDSDIAKITEIVIEETGAEASGIKIIETV